MLKFLDGFTRLFVVWVLAASALAYAAPALFTPLKGLIVPGLGVIMFGMGVTLLPEDFSRVVKMPRAVTCGIVGQFLFMPLLGLALAKIAALPPGLAMGMIIVGSCPGGTASNVITFLARGDVALSVTMTACSTVLAVALTPMFIWLYGGQYIPVDPWALLTSVLYIVLIPVAAGLLARLWLRDRVEKFLEVFPALSVLLIVLIIATIVAGAQPKLAQALGRVGLLVVAHNLLGLALGYAMARALKLPLTAQRTVGIEVGMQNSGLGVALASRHFASDPLVALPAALFSVVHNLSGSVLAAWFRRKTPPSNV